MEFRRLMALAVGLLALQAVFFSGPAVARWRPTPTTAPWQWQLQGKIDTGVAASVFDVDGFETPARVVQRLHQLGRHVICYLDVGSWESYRPDAGSFPRSVIGRRYEGFPDERWLDVRRFHLFAKVLEHRFDTCARKGFDAIEPDNVAGWENKTGFPISATAQLRFNRWVARQVHTRGMAIALKNDPRQVKQLLGVFDFAIVEECFQYDECGLYEPFVRAGKAVFEAEYELEPSRYCDAAASLDLARSASPTTSSHGLGGRAGHSIAPCPSLSVVSSFFAKPLMVIGSR